MINLMRIDYRLIHWQTGVGWVQNLKINTIVIANDAVARDAMRQGLMKAMGVSKSVDIKFLTVEEAILYLNSEESQPKRIELLIDNVEDAFEIVQKVPGINQINAAFMKIGPGKKMVNHSLAFGPGDIEIFKKMYDMGIESFYYTVPNEKSIPIRKYLN